MKTAFITGATSGIGFEFAKVLSASGYGLILHGRNSDKLNKLKDSLPNVIATLSADLSDARQLEAMLTELDNFSDTIHIAINNAGFGLYGNHTELKESDIDAMLAVNITTVTKLTRYFGLKMASNGQGYILNIASTAAYQPQPYLAAYAATKAYVASFSEAMAIEMKSSNVIVTCLSPGRTDTNFFSFDGADSTKSGKGTFAGKHRVSAESVAKLGIHALLKGKIREIPFLENKIYVFLNRILPKSVVLALYNRAMKGI